jgi:phosphatidylglycerol---prolipoprotein diacylglyceryl transferase
MYPEIFRIGDFAFTSFGLMLVLAFVGSYLQLSWGLRRTGAGDEEDASALVFAAGVAGIVGSKVYFAILYSDWRLLWSRSGLVWYGGFILGALAVLWVMRRRRLPGWASADAAAPALALGYAIGRVGCFLVGDDYGRPTDLPWGVKFPEGLPPTSAGTLRGLGVDIPADVTDGTVLAVHPTQLYETTMALVIWGVGVMLLRRRVRRGTVALLVLALLAVERFLVEILRAKDDRFLGPFTVAQALSVFVLLLIAVLWTRRPRGARPEAPAAASATP